MTAPRSRSSNPPPLDPPGPKASSVQRCLAELERRLGGRSLVVGLDYDGTLTPIVQRPELAELDQARRAVLARLAERCPVLILSGRTLTDVQERVGLDGLWYAGSHGFEIAGPGGLAYQHEPSAHLVPVFAELGRELGEALAQTAGVVVETKRFAVAVHFRMVAEALHERVVQGVTRAAAQRAGVAVQFGHMVVEIAPAVAWDKGRALDWILLATGHQDSFVLYLGDDRTDEDAFRVIADRGMGILVADRPRPTAAVLRLRDPDEVGELLGQLVEHYGQ